MFSLYFLKTFVIGLAVLPYPLKHVKTVNNKWLDCKAVPIVFLWCFSCLKHLIKASKENSTIWASTWDFGIYCILEQQRLGKGSGEPAHCADWPEPSLPAHTKCSWRLSSKFGPLSQPDMSSWVLIVRFWAYVICKYNIFRFRHIYALNIRIDRLEQEVLIYQGRVVTCRKA